MMTGALKGQTILVTGGTGFIGGRLVEKLVLECNANVRVLVRNFTQAARIGRFPVTMCHGEVTDSKTLSAAAEGCELIFHCAFPFSSPPDQWRKLAAAAAEAVAGAVRSQRVRRLVHVSTFSVYGRTPDGDLDEVRPVRYAGDVYADAKLNEQSVLIGYHQKDELPVVVVQPSVVYGPFSIPWTITPVMQIKGAHVVLPSEQGGVCNAVYVDDVVDAMLLASIVPGVEGQTYLVSGGQPVTWTDFYKAYEQILGVRSIVFMSLREIQEWRRQQRRKEKVRRGTLGLAKELVRHWVPEPIWKEIRARIIGRESPQLNMTGHSRNARPLVLPAENDPLMLVRRTRVCIDKASRQLGYSPRFDFESGMDVTGRWIRWANLV